MIAACLYSMPAFAVSDGALDDSFDVDGLVTTQASPVFSQEGAYSLAEDVIQVDGKLLAVGRSNIGGAVSDRFAVVRYLNNGALDVDFDGDGIVNTLVGSGHAGAYAVLRQADGKYAVAGQAINFNATATRDFAVVRYDANGGLDSGFGDGGIVLTSPHPTVSAATSDDGAYAIVAAADEKLVVAGFGGKVNEADFSLVRYQKNGSLDTAFGQGGKVATNFSKGSNDVAYALLQEDGGKLVAAGFSGSSGGGEDFAIARYLADGSLDPSFDSDGMQKTSITAGNDRGLALIRQKDGKYVVAGYGTTNGKEDIALVRYNANGSLDTGFNGGGKVRTSINAGNDRAYQVLEMPDGKLLVAGYTQLGETDFNFVLVRYNQNGSVDTTFNGDGKLTTSFGGGTDQAFAAVMQSDYRVVLAGAALVNNQRFALARYLPGDKDDDGVIDSSDNCPSVANANQTNTDEAFMSPLIADALGDACDSDDDGDGVLDKKDAFPLNPAESNDNDGDGDGDNADPDDDNDCVLDEADSFPFDANVRGRFSGEAGNDYFGFSVANAGDVDGDGVDDIMIGAPRHDNKIGKSKVADAGMATIFSGGSSTPSVVKIRSWLGESAGDGFGGAVAGGGDVNADHVPDFIIGAPKADVVAANGKKLKDAGRAVVYSGVDGSELFRVEGEAAGDNLGNAVAFVHNVDADDGDEILVGAWKADRLDAGGGKRLKDAGAAYLYSYKDTAPSLLHKFEGEGNGDFFGAALASSDVDKDGKADAIIGAYGADAPGIGGKTLRDAGRVYVYRNLSAAEEYFHRDGEHAGDWLGFAVAGLDVDGDGYADVLAGAPRQDVAPALYKAVQDAGSVQVYSGQSQAKLYDAHHTLPQAGARFGGALGGSGAHDFIVGAYLYDTVAHGKKQVNAGKVSMHKGDSGAELFSYEGHGKNNYFGFAVGSLNNPNSHDIADIIAGGYLDDPLVDGKRIANAGIVELLTGSAPGAGCAAP